MEYEIIENEILGSKTIKSTDENGESWYIPEDPANSDYQLYLAWKASQDANN